MYTIGEVVELTGITHYTLRYYEKESLVIPKRLVNGRRCYTEENLAVLRFILKMRKTQMPISKIKEYILLYNEGEKTTLARLHLLEQHQKYIQETILSYVSISEELDQKIKTYKKAIKQKTETLG